KIKNGEKATGWPTLAEELGANGDAVVKAVIAWLGLNASGNYVNSVHSVGPWPDPVALDATPEVPPYPVEILPDTLRTWAEAVALELQVPVDLPASLGLGLVAAGLARKVVVRPRDGFTEPVNQYVMAVLLPGERKSQSFRRAIAPVQKLHRDAREAAKPVIAEAESEQRIAEQRVKHLEGKIAKAELAEQDQLREDLKEAREALAKVEVPPDPLFYTEDDTPESLKLELVRQARWRELIGEPLKGPLVRFPLPPAGPPAGTTASRRRRARTAASSCSAAAGSSASGRA